MPLRLSSLLRVCSCARCNGSQYLYADSFWKRSARERMFRSPPTSRNFSKRTRSGFTARVTHFTSPFFSLLSLRVSTAFYTFRTNLPWECARSRPCGQRAFPHVHQPNSAGRSRRDAVSRPGLRQRGTTYDGIATSGCDHGGPLAISFPRLLSSRPPLPGSGSGSHTHTHTHTHTCPHSLLA